MLHHCVKANITNLEMFWLDNENFFLMSETTKSQRLVLPYGNWYFCDTCYSQIRAKNNMKPISYLLNFSHPPVVDVERDFDFFWTRKAFTSMGRAHVSRIPLTLSLTRHKISVSRVCERKACNSKEQILYLLLSFAIYNS